MIVIIVPSFDATIMKRIFYFFILLLGVQNTVNANPDNGIVPSSTFGNCIPGSEPAAVNAVNFFLSTQQVTIKKQEYSSCIPSFEVEENDDFASSRKNLKHVNCCAFSLDRQKDLSAFKKITSSFLMTFTFQSTDLYILNGVFRV